MKYDAILIPGGGVTKNGTLPEWTKRRLDKAVEIFTGKEFLIPLSAWSPHKPPYIRKGYPVPEAEVAADYLIKKGIPRGNIILEPFSKDTIGNIYFARVLHTDERGWKDICIITSEFHMPRTKEICNWIFNLKPKKNYKLDFLTVTDNNIDRDILRSRIIKERTSLANLRMIKKIDTLKKFHAWLFSEHEAYAPGLTPKRVKGKVLDSY